MEAAATTAIISIAIGIFLLLFGYRLKRIAITVLWFIIGYWLAKQFVGYIVSEQIWQIILCCISGLLLGMVGIAIERFAVFVTVGITFGMAFLQNFGGSTPDWATIAIAVAIGVVAGVIAVWLMKPMIIFATSFEGSSLVVQQGIILLNVAPTAELKLILLFAIAAFGIVFQWNSCRNLE